MIDLHRYKQSIMESYQNNVFDDVQTIKVGKSTHQEKAKLVNKLIADHQAMLKDKAISDLRTEELQQALLVLQYCTSVFSLEYRHCVWPYEYMALSRRVGELWERFCCSAWDCPSRDGVKRIDPPDFKAVSETIRNRIKGYLPFNYDTSDLFQDIDILFDLIGEINMREDEVFTVNDLPHVIDFKSGFGSNEKGNTLRLQTVGRAYKLWNPDTKLLFLVRQEENNNYLNVIKRSGLWDVRCGASAYQTIDELTGSNISLIREEIIDFQNDLSDEFWKELSSHLSDLTGYLNW